MSLDDYNLPPKLRKKLAIAKLAVEGLAAAKHLTSPEFEEAIKEREEYLSRDELWITPLSIKYAPIVAQLNRIYTQIHIVSSTPVPDHD